MTRSDGLRIARQFLFCVGVTLIAGVLAVGVLLLTLSLAANGVADIDCGHTTPCPANPHPERTLR